MCSLFNDRHICLKTVPWCQVYVGRITRKHQPVRRSGNAEDAFIGSARFESQTGHMIFRQVFLILLQSLEANVLIVTRVGHDCILIYQALYHSICSLATDHRKITRTQSLQSRKDVHCWVTTREENLGN